MALRIKNFCLVLQLTRADQCVQLFEFGVESLNCPALALERVFCDALRVQGCLSSKRALPWVVYPSLAFNLVNERITKRLPSPTADQPRKIDLQAGQVHGTQLLRLVLIDKVGNGDLDQEFPAALYRDNIGDNASQTNLLFYGVK